MHKTGLPPRPPTAESLLEFAASVERLRVALGMYGGCTVIRSTMHATEEYQDACKCKMHANLRAMHCLVHAMLMLPRCAIIM